MTRKFILCELCGKRIYEGETVYRCYEEFFCSMDCLVTTCIEEYVFDERVERQDVKIYTQQEIEECKAKKKQEIAEIQKQIQKLERDIWVAEAQIELLPADEEKEV